jgi:hypothetical protein
MAQPVDPLFAQWLMAEADFATQADSAAVARWGETAGKAERITGIARGVDASAEATRQLAFWSRGPFAVDVHTLVGGDWLPQRGRVVRLRIAKLGYGAGVDVFVLEAETDRATGLTQLTVLCPLGSTE